MAFLCSGEAEPMKAIQTDEYEILFGAGAYEKLREQLDTAAYSKVFVCVDENTRAHCLPHFSEHSGLRAFELISIQSGEEHKNLATCTALWQKLTEAGADRRSVLLNLGGGMLTDVGGFAATTFKRGMDFIHLPTTLLNMVDASIGGKTGINLGTLKNQIGLFSNPKMVLIDSCYLQTLPPREYRSGLAEVIKYGLSLDEKVYRALQDYPDFSEGERDCLIQRCAALKADVVCRDFRETGLRKALNVGHTLGHAIEAFFLQHPQAEKLLHGEAVAVGLIAEAQLSRQLNYLNTGELAALKRFILSLYPKVRFEESDFQQIRDCVKHDKKNVGHSLHFSLIRGIGKCAWDVAVSEEAIDEALRYYLSEWD